MQKRLWVPSRVPRLPHQFSWVDQRLVCDHPMARCDPEALARYLFLVTVADAQGLSFYADASIGRLVSLPPQRLERARAPRSSPTRHRCIKSWRWNRRCRHRLSRLASARASGELRTMREILRQALESEP